MLIFKLKMLPFLPFKNNTNAMSYHKFPETCDFLQPPLPVPIAPKNYQQKTNKEMKSTSYSLLKEEYDNLNNKYLELKSKYDELIDQNSKKRKETTFFVTTPKKQIKLETNSENTKIQKNKKTPKIQIDLELNDTNDVYVYNYKRDIYDHQELTANGKKIYLDINWDNIDVTEELKLHVYTTTHRTNNISETNLLSEIVLLREEGNKIKISKIRENLKKITCEKNILHSKYFVQIKGKNKVYTDKILLYSKTITSVGNFEPTDKNEYNDISKLFSDNKRFFVYVHETD